MRCGSRRPPGVRLRPSDPAAGMWTTGGLPASNKSFATACLQRSLSPFTAESGRPEPEKTSRLESTWTLLKLLNMRNDIEAPPPYMDCGSDWGRGSDYPPWYNHAIWKRGWRTMFFLYKRGGYAPGYQILRTFRHRPNNQSTLLLFFHFLSSSLQSLQHAEAIRGGQHTGPLPAWLSQALPWRLRGCLAGQVKQVSWCEVLILRNPHLLFFCGSKKRYPL